jgi:predicted 3-demethylubiquinone-9 3-methyltransferase (glyoxalase superfamily)
MQGIATHLWFKADVKEAVNFYVSLLPGAKIVDSFSFDNAGPDGKSSYDSITFEILGQRFMALNGAHFDFTPATSIFLVCDTQDEIDRLWDGLLEGGSPMACGWLTDRYGLSWQVAPAVARKLISEDSEAGRRALQAMMGMIKFDIAALQAAYDGK